MIVACWSRERGRPRGTILMCRQDGPALSHRICTGLPRRKLGTLIEELAGPWLAQQESRLQDRRGRDRLRAEGAGPGHVRGRTPSSRRPSATARAGCCGWARSGPAGCTMSPRCAPGGSRTCSAATPMSRPRPRPAAGAWPVTSPARSAPAEETPQGRASRRNRQLGTTQAPAVLRADLHRARHRRTQAMADPAPLDRTPRIPSTDRAYCGTPAHVTYRYGGAGIWHARSADTYDFGNLSVRRLRRAERVDLARLIAL